MIGLACGALFCLGVCAQPTPGEQSDQIAELKQQIRKLKVSGYVQAQYQYGEQAASMKVGAPNENPEAAFSRMGIRRGRVKFTYDEGIGSAVFQLDLTEKGIGFKDAYLNVKDPWTRASALRAGIFDRPFGYEISYSSSRRESPERSTVFQQLFPEERDLGAMLALQAPDSSPLSIFKLQAGLFAGNGIKPETDSRKDFIGQLMLKDFYLTPLLSVGLGASYYNGGVYQGTSTVYRMEGDSFVAVVDEANRGQYAKREYLGVDARIRLNTGLGATQLRGEYLFGQQPGTAKSSKSPNYAQLPQADTYLRNFRGAYVMLVQDIGSLPFALVLKYDWYDPNTAVEGDRVGAAGTSATDLAQQTLGVGALWHVNDALRLQAYYEFNRNEQSAQVQGMNQDKKNDLFTLRLQYKF